MFEHPRFGGTEPQTIIVQTRQGHALENFVALDPGFAGLTAFRAIVDRFGKNWHVRSEVGGVYNCAGLLWASRRTSLPNPADWQLILNEPLGDGYRRLPENENAETGDVAIYLHQHHQEILHVGRVSSVQWLFSPGGERLGTHPQVKILSKLDARLGEVIHATHDVCPLNGGEPYYVEYWTDRPLPKVRVIL